MVHWLDTRHWNRVMLTQCDMVTHVCTKLSGNWSNIYIYIYKCLAEMHSQMGNKKCTFSVFRCKGICRNSDDNERVPLWNMLWYRSIINEMLQPTKKQCLIDDGRLNHYNQVLHEKKRKKKRKRSEFMHVVLVYRQAIAWNACDFRFGLKVCQRNIHRLENQKTRK